MRRHDARFVGGLQDRCPCPVPEQHGSRSIVPIRDSGQGLGTDHQRRLAAARAEIAVGVVEAINESGTGGIDVDRGTADRAELPLHDTGHGRDDLIGRAGSDHDQVEVRGLDAGHVQRTLRSNEGNR